MYTIKTISFDAVMDRFAKALGLESDRAVADCLGISAAAYSNRKQRKSIPYEELIVYMSTHDVDIGSVLLSAPASTEMNTNSDISKEAAELILKCNDFIQEQCMQAGFDMPTEKRHMLAYGIAHETIKEFGFDFERARGFASMATRMSIDHQLELAKITQPKKDGDDKMEQQLSA